jgi:hypothetical protein
MTALMRAAENGHFQIVRLLLQHGAGRGAKQKDRLGRTALEIARESAGYGTNRGKKDAFAKTIALLQAVP